MIWSELSHLQLDAVDRDTPVVLPVAATEQHGPHLPLGVDAMIGDAIARRFDEACGGRLLVLPTQRVGCSEHHMGSTGTLTLSHETFRRVVEETATAAIRHGFRRLLILNSHGGNRAVNSVLCEQLGQRHADVETVVANWWSVAAEEIKAIREGGPDAMGHACEMETSVMLAIAPDLVDMAKAVDDGQQPRASMLAFNLFHGGPATMYQGFDELTRHGVFGKATLASAEKGERILAAAVAGLQTLIEQVWGRQ